MCKLSLIITILLIGCSSNWENEEIQLSEDEKEILYNFATQLTKSIQNLEYDLIRSSWSHDAFKIRVSRLLKSNPTVFNYIYDEEIEGKVNMDNVNLINIQKNEKGKLYKVKTDLLRSHAEVTYLLIYGGSFKFLKYRIELLNNKPTLTDYFLFSDNIWKSQSMANIARLNKRYLAGSNERTQANLGFINYQKSLERGDTLTAFRYLNDIPRTHQFDNTVSLLKIRCAQTISDSMFLSVLESEKRGNNSVYLNYLHAYFSNDSVELERIFRHLEQQVGIPGELIDVIQKSRLIWN